jgi:hypothetical protein
LKYPPSSSSSSSSSSLFSLPVPLNDYPSSSKLSTPGSFLYATTTLFYLPGLCPSLPTALSTKLLETFDALHASSSSSYIPGR